MRKVVADFSRLLNCVFLGAHGKTLCWRAAMTWGDNCLFCRVVGWAMREPWHCYDELDAHDLFARLKRK